MIHQLWLLAERQNWKRMGDRFSGENAKLHLDDVLFLLGAIAAVAAVLWLLSFAAKWQTGESKKSNPARLFRELCRTHRLNRWERGVLIALAEQSGARQPAEVFVRPEAFTNTLPEKAENNPEAYQRLRQKLFE